MDRDEPSSRDRAIYRAARDIGAPVGEVWRVFTTRSGLEAWWPPEGFAFSVLALEPQVGGRVEFQYEEAFAALSPTWARELERIGSSSRWYARGSFLVFEPERRLSLEQSLEFGRGVPPIAYRLTAEFEGRGSSTRLTLEAESLTTRHWISLGERNLAGQLDRIEAALRSRAGP